MKYKLRGDYSFKTTDNKVLKNKLNADGIVIEPVIIDSKQHEKAISEQMHMLEVVVEKKLVVTPPPVEPKPTEVTPPPENTNDNKSDSSKPDDNGQQSLPLQAGSNTRTGEKGNR